VDGLAALALDIRLRQEGPPCPDDNIHLLNWASVTLVIPFHFVGGVRLLDQSRGDIMHRLRLPWEPVRVPVDDYMTCHQYRVNSACLQESGSPRLSHCHGQCARHQALRTAPNVYVTGSVSYAKGEDMHGGQGDV
jgi:hypothetical protein